MATEGVALVRWVIYYLLWVRIKLFYLPHFCMAVPIPHGLNITSTKTLGGHIMGLFHYYNIANAAQQLQLKGLQAIIFLQLFNSNMINVNYNADI